MTQEQLVKLSKLLSLMLRHEPSRFGIELDPEGYASLIDVLDAAKQSFENVTAADIRAVVDTIESDKRRFTIVEDEIRANYGHSLVTKISHQKATPPAKLWHGTTNKALSAISKSGLSPMKRQYVHLTTDKALAQRVGSRRGEPIVITIDAAKASAAGITFYQANNNFWLVDNMPPEFIEVPH